MSFARKSKSTQEETQINPKLQNLKKGAIKMCKSLNISNEFQKEFTVGCTITTDLERWTLFRESTGYSRCSICINFFLLVCVKYKLSRTIGGQVNAKR